MSQPDQDKMCSSRYCRNTLPPNAEFKKCQACRELDNKYQKARRARLKENKENIQRNGGNGRKRPASSNPDDRKPLRQRLSDKNRGVPWGEGDDSDDEGHETDNSDMNGGGNGNYPSAKAMFERIRQLAAEDSISFKGTYQMEYDSEISDRQRVSMVANEIWTMTGYRFTVRDNTVLESGHSTRYWCCQDEARKKKAKPSTAPGAKHREHVGMKRFACGSRLMISCRRRREGNQLVTVHLTHRKKHLPYVDVSTPEEVLDIIREGMEHLTPGAMVTKIQQLYPNVTANQIHTAWRTLSQAYWRRDDDQIKSARLLLEEYQSDVDLLKLNGIPAGVEALAWGMKKVAGRLRGKVVEIAIDATYNTNARHLELYCIMIEVDNVGYPVSYMLMTTASAVEQGKRTKALEAWARALEEKYNLNPVFAHTDKDMGEIGCLKAVWNPKINLCWWHLRKAVKTRLGKTKLATTPYNVLRARTEFSFIDITFVPLGKKTDMEDFEGGLPDDMGATTAPTYTADNNLLPLSNPPPTLTFKLPPRTQANTSRQSTPVLDDPEGDEDNDGTRERNRRTFCPPEYRESILSMMEKHYCAHPLIPGYSDSTPEAIRQWATRQMYRFCEKYDLPEVWAYLWENWYRRGRWELWARSQHPEIPVLKTTMILEGHWRRVKKDFLHQFHLPRCDILVWVIVKKLAPHYYRKMDRLLVNTGRYRELGSWRKDFKKRWRELERKDVSNPINVAYSPNIQNWTCSCPSFATSRFLICKHLIHLVRAVPAIFFLEACRARTTPFWKHPALVPKDPDDAASTNGSKEVTSEGEQESGDEGDYGYDDDASEAEGEEEMVLVDEAAGSTFEEDLDTKIGMLMEFADGLRYQKQFRDQRLARALEREGGGLWRVMKDCLEKERRAQSTRGANPGTWENKTNTAMWYRARPKNAENM